MSAQDLAELEEARRNVASAKARVQSSAGALRQRLQPASLAASAIGGVRRKTGVLGDKVAVKMRKRPAATTVAAGLAAFILFRKPLQKLARRLFGKGGNSSPDAAARSPAAASANQE